MGKFSFNGKASSKASGIARPVSSKRPVVDLEGHAFENMIYWGIVIASIVGILVIIGFIALQQANPANSQGFTAIYFEDYNKGVENNQINFSFTISNQEGKDMPYTVDINFDSTIIKTIELIIPRDTNRTENISLPFDLDKKTTHKISTSLKGRNESIHYWTSLHKEYPAIFGENIAFISYKIEPLQVKSFSDFNITYTWKCLKPTSEDFTVFVHFVDSAGKIAFQQDHVLKVIDANGMQIEYPTSKCAIGETFSENYKLKSKETGSFPIRLGFYRQGFGRLPVDNDNPDNFFVIGSLKVS